GLVAGLADRVALVAIAGVVHRAGARDRHLLHDGVVHRLGAAVLFILPHRFHDGAVARAVVHTRLGILARGSTATGGAAVVAPDSTEQAGIGAARSGPRQQRGHQSDPHLAFHGFGPLRSTSRQRSGVAMTR